MKILFAGGGTMGSVSPLLAIYERAKKDSKNWEYFWVGTKNGPERQVVTDLGIDYEWLLTAKLRRYFSLHILIDPFLFIISFFRSLLIIATVKPDIIISTGSFVAVPVIWAAWLWRKKIIIHQQDIRPTLSNKLTAWCATKITASFAKSLADYPKKKTKLIGNPVRAHVSAGNKTEAIKLWNLDENFPTLLVVGGSSGAGAFNNWVWENIASLIKIANVLHITGRGNVKDDLKQSHYTQVEFLDKDMPHGLAVADVVLSRAGISALSELAYLSKAVVVVPMPKTHQEDNANYFADQHAVCLFRQDQLDEHLVNKIGELLTSPGERANLADNIGQMMPKNADKRFVEIIEEME